jgi:hypothetical protein
MLECSSFERYPSVPQLDLNWSGWSGWVVDALIILTSFFYLGDLASWPITKPSCFISRAASDVAAARSWSLRLDRAVVFLAWELRLLPVY